MSDKFSFHIPIELTKANKKDTDGDEVWKIGGIASTSSKDADNEFLDPNGFDLSYFKRKGMINWNHQSSKDPSMYIGKPTNKTKVDKDGLYVEAELYKDSDMAKKVWGLAKILEENDNPDRRLGFSIEGQVVERDKEDSSKVTKAKITGCAVTMMPKNPDTLLKIIKGGVPMNESETAYSDGDGGAIVMVPVMSENGDVWRVYENGAIEVEKAKKALTTASGAALRAESVDEESKALVKSQKSATLGSKLQDSEIYQKILNITSDISKADRVFDIIKKYSDMTEDTLSKALARLAKGDTGGDEKDILQKMTDMCYVHMMDGGSKDEAYEKMKKMGDYDSKMYDSAYGAAGEKYKNMKKGDDRIAELEGKLESITKSLEGLKLGEAPKETGLEKALTRIEKLGEKLEKAESTNNEALEILKAISPTLLSINEKQSFDSKVIQTLGKRLNIVENQPIQMAKGTTATGVLQKGEIADDDKNITSLSLGDVAQREVISKLLFEKGESLEKNSTLQKNFFKAAELAQVGSSIANTLSPFDIKNIETAYNCNIVK